MKWSEIFQKYGVKPSKQLGQNFLIDDACAEKIVNALDVKPEETVIEIGPGCGALTHVLEKRAKKVIAIDADRYMCHIIESEFPAVTVINESILDVALSVWVPEGEKIKVIGNVPYYITNKILFHVLAFREHVSRMVVTMQKEVADRVRAEPGSKVYGRLSVGMQAFSRVQKISDLKAGSFFPQPDVISTALSFDIARNIPDDMDDATFLAVVACLFQERRKTIHNRLAKYNDLGKEYAGVVLNRAGVDPKSRAEQLSIDQFVDIVKAL